MLALFPLFFDIAIAEGSHMANDEVAARLMHFASSEPLCNFRFLVLCEQSLHSLEHLVFGCVGQWSIEEYHLYPASFEFFDKDLLMDIVSGEPVRRVDQNGCKKLLAGIISQLIEARTSQETSAPSLVNVAVKHCVTVGLGVAFQF